MSLTSIRQKVNKNNTMIRLIILFAIFLAVYPMIGEGWAAFSNDFNVAGVTDFVSEQIAKFNK